MKLDHAKSHGVAGGIRIEGAEDGQRLREQGSEPGRMRSGAGGGKAAKGRMEDQTTEGVDGRFSEDEGLGLGTSNGGAEEAVIFAGAGSQTAPKQWNRAA